MKTGVIMRKPMIKMSLDLSPHAYEMLEQICDDNYLSKTELMRKSLGLISLAYEYKKSGSKLVVIDKDNNQISEIIGI